MNIPFVDLSRQYDWMKDELNSAICDVAASGQYILGKRTEAFETELARITDSRYALGLANGTDALVIGLKLLGIGAGDEVIVPVNSFTPSIAVYS